MAAIRRSFSENLKHTLPFESLESVGFFLNGLKEDLCSPNNIKIYTNLWYPHVFDYSI